MTELGKSGATGVCLLVWRLKENTVARATGAMVEMDTDYLSVFSDVSDEDTALAERARAIVDEHVLPRVADWYEAGVFPREIVPRLGSAGLLGPTIPGVGAATSRAWGLACLELERGDSGLRSFASVQSSLVMYPIQRYGSPEQQSAWLPRLASGEAIGCFALSEPAGGSDPGTMATVAERRLGGGYRLNGHKRWATSGTLAQVAIVWAQTDPLAGGRGIRAFLLPTDHPGVDVQPIDRKLSMRCSASSEIFLRDVEVGADAMLPGATGLGAALSCLTEARYSIVWGVIGAATACYEAALAHVRSRSTFGRPVASFQLVQQHLVEMLDRITTAQLIADQLARLKDAGRMRHQQVSFAKRHSVAAAQDVVARARALLGAEGIILDRHVMRHQANLETVATYEGTHEIQTLVVGADITGLPAFR
jgi:glutaryl-CoA dehydrogenase